MHLHLERAQKWSNKCMKLAFRNTDKTYFARQWTDRPALVVEWHQDVEAIQLLSWTKLLWHTLTSDNSTKECHYTNNFLLSRFLFGWDWCRVDWPQWSLLILTWIVLKCQCLTYRFALIYQYIQCRVLQKQEFSIYKVPLLRN